MIRPALLFLLLATPLCAQEPEPTIRAPHDNRKALIAEVSLLAAAKTADAITTRQLLDRGGVSLILSLGAIRRPPSNH